MKKKSKIFYILQGDNPNRIFWEKNKNSRYFFDEEQVYFDCKVDGKIGINLKHQILNLDEILVNELKNLIDPAIVDASGLSEEQIELRPNTKDEIIRIISITTNTACYNNWSIFKYVSEIFIKCLMFHTFINGNKRFSLSLLILILQTFGYHLSWSKGSQKNYKYHEDIIANFVEQLQNDETNNEKLKSAVEEKIVKWIETNTVVSIP